MSEESPKTPATLGIDSSLSYHMENGTGAHLARLSPKGVLTASTPKPEHGGTANQRAFKINQPRPQKNNCRPPQVWFILGSNFQMPRLSVETIVHKYKHHGTTQPSYRSGRRRVLSPRDKRTLVRKVQINPRTTAKDLVKMLEETGTKVSIATVKRILYRHNLKGRSARKKPLLQNRH